MRFPLLFWFIKFTGLPIDWAFFTRKVYYEDRRIQKKKLKGGVLIVGNHRSFWDYITVFFLFFFHRVRPVVSYQIFHRNAILRFFLKMVGSIVVGKDRFDVSYINTCVELLKKGKKIIIFPEGHFIKDDSLAPFSPSYLKIAELAHCPILPVYTDGRYALNKRNHIMIGTPIRVWELSEKEEFDREELNGLNEIVVGRFRELRRQMGIRKKNHIFRFRYLFMDIGRISAYMHFIPFFRTKVHEPKGMKNYHKMDGPFIIAGNHTSFSDPMVLINAFWRRRVNFLVAKEVYKNNKLRTVLLNGIGGIKIDRSAFDIEAIRRCVDGLNASRPLIIFPEGHIATNGQPNPLKDGVGIIASKAKCPILPVYICPAKHWFSRHHIYIGERIYPTGGSLKDCHQTGIVLSERFQELGALADEEGHVYHGKC